MKRKSQKNSVQIFRISLVLGFFLVGVIIIGLLSKPEVNYENRNVGFDVLKKGVTSSIDERDNKIVHSSEELIELWKENFPDEKIAPELDFEEYMVLGIFMGRQDGGGRDIEVTKIVETQRKVYVYLTDIYPGENCIVTKAITSPHRVIKVKKFEKDLEFIRSDKIVECNES